MDVLEARTLASLLLDQRIAALATLHRGEPAVSMVPFALLPGGPAVAIHVSRLAAHTNDMLAEPGVGLMVVAPLDPAESPLALPRLSLQARVRPCPAESPDYERVRAAYLAKIPESEPLFSFADFSLFVLEIRSARFVAGFGRALSLSAEQLAAALGDGS